MFYEKKVLVFDRGQLKRGHHVTLTMENPSSGRPPKILKGLIQRIDDYNMTVYEESLQDFISIFVGEVRGYPDSETRLVQFTIEEVTPTRHSDK